MQEKISIPTGKKFFHFEQAVEASTWIIVVIVIFGVRFLPQQPIGNSETYYLIGAIIALALLYIWQSLVGEYTYTPSE